MKGGQMNYWIGPIFGKIIHTTLKGVLFERINKQSPCGTYVIPEKFPIRQWIPKVAFKSAGMGYDISVNQAGEFYIAKWFIRKIELQASAGILMPSPQVPTNSEVIESFGRKRMIRPEIDPAQQKKADEKKIEKAKQERFFGNVDKVLDKILEPESEKDRLPKSYWSRHPSGDIRAFVCEASDNPSMCPRCRKSYGFPEKDVIMRERDQEGEIQAWHYKHECGASLIVLND